MGKKNNNNQRLSESKVPVKDKTHFKRSVHTARQIHYYESGEGSKGLHIRRPRVVKKTRKILNELSPPTGAKKRNMVIYKGAMDMLCTAIDSYGKRLMELAAEFARNRAGKDAKGLKLRKQDLEAAYRWQFKISNQ